MKETPIIISVAHQKGGVGKSTLAYNLASYFTKQGDRCAIVDADFQGTITDLFHSFGKNNVLGGIDLITKDSIKDYKELLNQKKYNLLIIDTPPYISTELPDIFQISDFILIPTKPAVNDFLAIDRTLDFAKKCKLDYPNIHLGIVINMTISGSKFTKDIREELEGKEVTILKTEIGQRVEFTRYHLYTDSIYGTSDKKAQKEISALGAEIFDIITTK